MNNLDTSEQVRTAELECASRVVAGEKMKTDSARNTDLNVRYVKMATLELASKFETYIKTGDTGEI